MSRLGKAVISQMGGGNESWETSIYFFLLLAFAEAFGCGCSGGCEVSRARETWGVR